MDKAMNVRVAMAVLGLLSAAGASTAAAADPVVYVCRTDGIGSPTYMQLDEKLKTVSMGRAAGQYVLSLPAIFNAKTVTWSRVEGKVTWNYTFDPAAGTLVYGWRTGPGDQQQDICKKI